MIQPNIACYALFRRNNSKVKRNGELQERKIPRFDLSAYNGYWTGLEKLATKKGDTYLSLVPSDKNPNRKKGGSVMEYYAQMRPSSCKGTFNLSGLRLMQDTEAEQWICCGEPSADIKLRTGDWNPLYDERNDGFVFVVDKAFQWIELWVVADQRFLIDGYRKAFELGTYNAALERIRMTAKDVG